MGATVKRTTKQRQKQDATLAERDLIGAIDAAASEVETLATCYMTFAPDFGRSRQMSNLIAIIGERCATLVRLIDKWQKSFR